MIKAGLVFLCLCLAAPVAAQTMNGNNVGNGNIGLGNGNGNSNGNGNGNGNTSAASLNQKYVNTPAVFAPGLAAAGSESCLGSASVGGAGGGIGLTFGTTTIDHGCSIRLYARTLFALGHRMAATYILCNDPEVAAALATEGFYCSGAPTDPTPVGTVRAAPAEPPAPAPVRAAQAQTTCRHYELFRGCLD